ncbi:type IV pilin accessory protein [Acinetobacter indicus]|uniref:Type IV pilin accessory protein n=1 Tax=Acinetobacter indicus TaxID=756892 RepID=A0A7S6VQM0_9GAMM|nr:MULTISPECIES: TfpX/TfpZ family type IV pilin accessory protein [Acinetobacter]QIC72494.1 type IV pilin accessory protein [Acinetobacter indicus]QIC77025.1 type IV pilin accessory protein [Acinetobacter indicus]QOW43150.1 type IV pilin accessory protein [Acinetobacter indicus]
MSKRIKFFLGHLLISVVIALFATYLIFGVWYPKPLDTALGVSFIFLMMIAIDVIVGPFLGLLVYKEGKKTLKMDLGVIIAVQVLAFGYGMYNLMQARPVWLVQTGHVFELVRHSDLVVQDNAHPDYNSYTTWTGPKAVAIDYGKTYKEKGDWLMKDMADVPAAFRPSRFTSLQQAKLDLQDNQQSIDTLVQFNDTAAVEQIKAKYPQVDAWLPLRGGDMDMVVLINSHVPDVVAIVDLRPWH